MRVPFPESSAVEPSGFQIAIATDVGERPSTSSTPSVPWASSEAVASSSGWSGSTTTYVLPSACQVDDVVDHLLAGAVRIDELDSGNATHPLALIRRVLARALDEPLGRL